MRKKGTGDKARAATRDHVKLGRAQVIFQLREHDTYLLPLLNRSESSVKCEMVRYASFLHMLVRRMSIAQLQQKSGHTEVGTV